MHPVEEIDFQQPQGWSGEQIYYYDETEEKSLRKTTAIKPFYRYPVFLATDEAKKSKRKKKIKQLWPTLLTKLIKYFLMPAKAKVKANTTLSWDQF